MTVRLLERDAELGRLRETLRRAGRGRGSVVLVSGEAGIGKTSLVRAFAEHARARARVLIGVCDDLVTPRTLGPFRDMARGGDGPLAEAAASVAERDAVFGAVYQELSDRSTVMIVEDVHWADDATLDVVRYLAWRIAELPSVLVLTYRDDELRDDHPLRRLSPSAVQELATPHGADARAVLHATGGNPFFVTEVLASPDADVPATVRDAVLARLGQLGDGTQRSLELLSTIPGQVERWLVDSLLGDDAAALDEAERRGVLEADPPTSGSGTSSRGAPSCSGCRPPPASPTTGGSSPRSPGSHASSCPGWPTTRTRPASPSRSSSTAWPPPAKPPPPARSTRRSRTTSSSCGGPACCPTSSGRRSWRTASGCSTTSPASTRPWRARARGRPPPRAPRRPGGPRAGAHHAVAHALHGQRPGRVRGGRDARRRAARTARRPPSPRPRLHLPGGDPRADRPPRRGDRPGAAGAGARRAHRPAGRRRPLAQLPRVRAARPRRPERRRAPQAGGGDRAGGPPLRVRPALLHQPGRGPVPPGTVQGARRADRAGAGVRARVRLRLPRVQPGGAPLHAAHAAGTVGGGRGRAAAPAGRRGPRRAGQLRPVRARSAARPQGGPDRRGAAGAGVAAGHPHQFRAGHRARRHRAGRVGVAGR